MISWVAPVNPCHPYLENAPAPPYDPHHLRISPWLWFSGHLGHRFLALHRLKSHLGLERWAVPPLSLRHFLLLPDSNRCPQFRSGTLT